MVQMRRTPLSTRGGDYRAGQMASHMHLGTAVAVALSSPQRTHNRPQTLEFKQLTEKLKHNRELSGDTGESLWSGVTAADGSINFTQIIYLVEPMTNVFDL